jgi:hypothetical protein
MLNCLDGENLNKSATDVNLTNLKKFLQRGCKGKDDYVTVLCEYSSSLRY